MELREADIKEALANYLNTKGYLDEDAVLINELPVDNFSRRVDFAVANGKLHAFEIKSDVDSLSRLEGQVETFRRYFDKVTVVCSSRFTEKIKETTPKDVSVLEVNSKKDGKIYFKLVRRGKTKLIRQPEPYLSFVDKKNIISFLRSEKIACSLGSNRKDIYKAASSIPINSIRRMVTSYLKNKYKDTTKAFMEHAESSPKTADRLGLLSKNKLQSNLTNGSNSYYNDIDVDPMDELIYPVRAKSIDITNRLEQFGIIPTTDVRIAVRARKA